MQCPQCGYRRQAEDDAFVPRNECPACGIVSGEPEEVILSSGPIRNPSPVSASTLRKARERVEQRLRKQQMTQHQDSRHNQTLELARRLSAEGVKKRRAEWEKKQKEALAAGAAATSAPVHPEEKAVPDLSVDGLQPGTKRKQPAKTISRALDRKAQEPKIAPQAARDNASKSPPEASDRRTVGKKSGADRPHESPTTDKGLESETPPSIVDAATESHGPIPLFQNKPVAPKAGYPKPPPLKEMIEDLDPPLLAPIEPDIPQPFQRSQPYHGLMRLLPFVAWLILGTGVIGMFLSWTTIGNVEAGMQMPTGSPLNLLPFGLLLGFAYLATGVLGFAFFWVSSLINGQLKDIHRLLLKQPTLQITPKQLGATEPDNQFKASD